MAEGRFARPSSVFSSSALLSSSSHIFTVSSTEPEMIFPLFALTAKRDQSALPCGFAGQASSAHQATLQTASSWADALASAFGVVGVAACETSPSR